MKGSNINKTLRDAIKTSKHGISALQISNLNAPVHSLAEGSTPTTPNKKERKMKKKDCRERVLQVRLSQEEFDAIERKFRNSGMKSKSAFVRAIIFEGHLVYFNENELKEIR